MTNKQEWNDFLENLFTNAVTQYEGTKECEYLKEKQQQLNARIDEKQLDGSREFLENCIFEMGLDDERKSEFVYRQGMKDCVWLLKNLGVLS